MSDAAMTFVCGMRGMGKSTRVKELLRGRKRVLVFDPMGEYAVAGYRRLSWSEMGRTLTRAGTSKGFRVSYVPKKGASRAAALHKISLALLDWQERTRGKRITLVVEEMAFSYPDKQLPAELYGFKEMCSLGRHQDIEVIGTTQRPAMVSTVFTGNCEDRYIFRLEEAVDIERIGKTIGRENRDKIKGLQRHEFLRYHAAQLTRGKNRLKP